MNLKMLARISKKNSIALAVDLLLLAYIHSSYQQQQEPASDLVNIVNHVFSNSNNNDRSVQNSGSFDRIVKPVTDVNEQIDFQSISGRSQCSCVPYHMCRITKSNNSDDFFDGFGLIDLRFNQDDAPICEHFLDKCCDVANVQNKSLTPRSQNNRPYRPQGCGLRNLGGIDFNITGANNNEAGFGEFPWTVALLLASNLSYFCAGSLIHPQVVLTAVHCINSPDRSKFIVRAGEWDTQTTKERLPFVERLVRRVIIHPQFNYKNAANDFALVVLDQPYVLGDHINVVCLPLQNNVPAKGITCISTGWGKLLFGANNSFSAIMKRIYLPIVDWKDCERQLRNTRLGPRFVLDRSFICAGGERDIDTCEGDGGAPLVCSTGIPSDNRYELSGMVAWGIGCNDEIPAAYAHVGSVRHWIDEQMLANGFDTSSYSILN